MDRHTQVRYERNPGFLERVGSSLVGILVGLVLIVAGCVLIFWNEGRAVQTAKSLDEGLRLAVNVPNPDVISMENNGKLVHIVGLLATEKALSDSDYSVAVHAVKLRRSVQMYQWVEHESESRYNEGGQTRVEKTYSYSKEWRSDLVRSQSFDSPFNHENPSDMAVKSKTLQAERVHVGEFSLSDALIGKISDYKQLLPSHSYRATGVNVKVHDGIFYHSLDPLHPQVGDLRVKFEYAGISGKTQLGPPAQVSIIARQSGSQLAAYQTAAGDQLEILYHGSLSVKEIFGREQMQNTMLTWGIRFGGWLLMFIAFSCLTSILTTLVDWFPIVRDIVALGVCLMNLSLSISLSLTVIALGWIRYRPLLGMTILTLSLTPFVLSRLRRSNSSRSRQD